MAVEDIEDRLKTKRKITHPRPGHADLVGLEVDRRSFSRNRLFKRCPYHAVLVTVAL